MPQSVPEILIYDEPDECPYLPGRTSRLPLRMPLRKLTPLELDERLAAGERRSGAAVYNTRCPGCQACEPIRVEVSAFVRSRTQTRIWKRGERRFRIAIGPPRVDAERVELFNRHKHERGLSRTEDDVAEEDYRAFLIASCCDTREIAYFLNDRLAMVAIIDCGARAFSAVYTYFDPDLGALSPGVYSVLKQIDLCRALGRRYLYLGYYVAGSRHMAYKAGYRPHERRVAGAWVDAPSSPEG